MLGKKKGKLKKGKSKKSSSKFLKENVFFVDLIVFVYVFFVFKLGESVSIDIFFIWYKKFL